VQQREVARVRAHRRRQKKLDDLINIVKTIQIGAPTCDVNAHLNVELQLGVMCGIRNVFLTEQGVMCGSGTRD
jgi:hypothetical protein